MDTISKISGHEISSELKYRKIISKKGVRIP